MTILVKDKKKSLSWKKIIGLCALCFSSLSLTEFTYAERLIPFQGRLHDVDNQLVDDGVYSLTFNVYETPTGGSSVWTETHQNVSVINGYVNILLGAIEFFDQPPSASVNFSTSKYLSVSINNGEELFPRTQLVPSFHATSADQLGNLREGDIATKEELDALNTTLRSQISGNDSDITGLSTTINNNAEAISNNAEAISDNSGDITSNGNAISTLNGRFVSDGNGGFKSRDADRLDGRNSSEFLTSSSTASNSSRLNNQPASYYRNAANLTGTISRSRLPLGTTTSRGAVKKASFDRSEDGYFWDRETGYIMQWGRTSARRNAWTTVSFKTPFGSTPYSVTFTQAGTDTGVHRLSSVNSSSFRVYNTNDDESVTFYWQAVGYKAP